MLALAAHRQKMPGFVQNPLDLDQQDGTLRRNRDTPAGAFKKRYAQMIFQFTDLFGKRRLADAAALRGPAEMAELSDRLHIFQVAQG